jgi:hypothetical protein
MQPLTEKNFLQQLNSILLQSFIDKKSQGYIQTVRRTNVNINIVSNYVLNILL